MWNWRKGFAYVDTEMFRLFLCIIFAEFGFATCLQMNGQNLMGRTLYLYNEQETKNH